MGLKDMLNNSAPEVMASIIAEKSDAWISHQKYLIRSFKLLIPVFIFFSHDSLGCPEPQFSILHSEILFSFLAWIYSWLVYIWMFFCQKSPFNFQSIRLDKSARSFNTVDKISSRITCSAY